MGKDSAIFTTAPQKKLDHEKRKHFKGVCVNEWAQVREKGWNW